MVTDGQMKLNLPLELKAWVKDQAALNRRSLNNQVVVFLEQCRARVDVKVEEVAA